MIKAHLINFYISKEFLKVVLNTSLSFFALGYVINLFEEINFFKDFDVGIDLPLKMSLLFVPSMFYNMFPFVILLSSIWFFLKLKRTEEITAMKVSGMSNFSVIIVPAFLALLLGIIFITSINPITSVLVKKYESIKGNYEKDHDYLAAVTENGIWIKEKKVDNNYIIRAAKLKNNYLYELTIYEFDKLNNFLFRIESESADISNLKWNLGKSKILDKNGKVIKENTYDITYKSLYDVKKIRSLYSNLDTISFWNLENEIKILQERGYSTNEMRAKLQRSLAFPFFLISMTLLGGVFTLGFQFKEDNWTYGFIAIITSVLIFYFNDFSAALGKTDKLPVEISVWMPILIIFIFSTIGLIHANQR